MINAAQARRSCCHEHALRIFRGPRQRRSFRRRGAPRQSITPQTAGAATGAKYSIFALCVRGGMYRLEVG